MTEEIRIFTQINNQYQVFDTSGFLPFSIVFGLCRQHRDDTDSRPLLLETAGSVLDVPYALAHGLLTLHEQNPEGSDEWCDEQWIEVDLGRLEKVAPKGSGRLSLSSPVNRTENWRDAFTVYRYPIDVHGELASMLKLGKKYRMRLASADLGIKRWAYSDATQSVDNDEAIPSRDLEAAKLVISRRTAGHATFTVVEGLPRPPKMEISMRLDASQPSSAPSTLPNTDLSNGPTLLISVLNTSSDTVMVQTRGIQRFLIPWDHFQPEYDADDRMRIIDAAPHKPPTSSLQVVDATTGKVVRGNRLRSSQPMIGFNRDVQPKVEDLLTLRPGAPVARKIDIGALGNGLLDGRYRVQMQTKGCRWWWQRVIEEDEIDDGRISKHLYGTLIPPLILESRDELELSTRDGKVQDDTVREISRHEGSSERLE